MTSPIKSLLIIAALGFTSACAEETREGGHSETTGAEARADDDRLAENRRNDERLAEDRRNEERLAEDRRNGELRNDERDDQAREDQIANDGESLTAQDQSNTESDLAITQAIRSALTGDDSLSMSARNVTIITEDSVVTLRGNVNSAAERSKVERHSMVEGVERVDNAIIVSR